ncbi:RagB/SusD family nutrient uptake outer membrane protein [Sphingobacterium sp. HJSM2_6]|uniref:RagB/SusD family nutrient uptake outer membrane protein n=1 Tax=Sphingobacterium sp. HJSM2_6 TaxID=3366264 RepID=UPI003BE59912
MKNIKTLCRVLPLISLLFSGCDKYLDISPKGKTLLTTVTDYDQWLNDDEKLYYGIQYWNYLGDNIDLADITIPAIQPQDLIYLWSNQYSVKLEEEPIFWGNHYAKINLFNTVLIGIDKATGGTNLQKRNIKAEALLGRSLEYFYLMNEYCQPYDSKTSSQVPGIPYVTSNDVNQEVPLRGTLEELYQQLIRDLKMAIADLPKNNSLNRFRGSIAAGYSVLSRLHFYARNYDEARKNAELALESSNASLINFNGPFPNSNFLYIHPDVIYARQLLTATYPTLDFLRSFASNDKRVRALYYSMDGYQFEKRNSNFFSPGAITPSLTYTNTGTSVQEMKLIVAECAARNNDLGIALMQLDEIRKNRFSADSYIKFESTDQQLVLEEILKERIHELPFNGLRWFDMRRLSMENKMNPVHRYDVAGKVIATLAPGSNTYTLQIPFQVISLNPKIQQNPI